MYTENRRQYSWPGSAFFPRFLGNRTRLLLFSRNSVLKSLLSRSMWSGNARCFWATRFMFSGRYSTEGRHSRPAPRGNKLSSWPSASAILSVKRQAWSSPDGRYPHDDSDRFRGVRKKRTRPIHLYYICSDGLMRSQRNS
jgi:hypothetical protein